MSNNTRNTSRSDKLLLHGTWFIVLLWCGAAPETWLCWIKAVYFRAQFREKKYFYDEVMEKQYNVDREYARWIL